MVAALKAAVPNFVGSNRQRAPPPNARRVSLSLCRLARRGLSLVTCPHFCHGEGEPVPDGRVTFRRADTHANQDGSPWPRLS
jgi:hypothetical protein